MFRWNLDKRSWLIGILLILFFGGIRFSAVLYGIQSGDNKYLSILFVFMILTPFVLLTKTGRKSIGFKRISLIHIFYSLFLGAAICSAIYNLGQWLFGNEITNWFRYIGESYPTDISALSEQDKSVYFIIFSVIGLTFSPFGEEFLYRGVIHGSFLDKLGDRGAAIIDSLAFALVHLAHFGIVFTNQSWTFLPLPSFIWLILMFATGMVLNHCKSKSGSIWGAVIGHMAFNLLMTYFIFYRIF